jgi:hypothetical protein
MVLLFNIFSGDAGLGFHKYRTLFQYSIHIFIHKLSKLNKEHKRMELSIDIGLVRGVLKLI